MLTRTVLCLAALLAPTLASAKQPGPAPSELTLIRPFHLEQDVPLNTRIWLDDESAREPSTYVNPREPRLFAPDDVVVPLGESLELIAAAGKLRVYTPPTLLPNTTYELRNCDDNDCSHPLATFTTATASDSTPPAPPEIHNLEILTSRHFILDAEFADDILVIGNAEASSEPLASRALVAAVSREHALKLAVDDLPSLELRFATYDLAGNFSGWTPPHDVQISQGCTELGCRTTDPTPWLLLLPFLSRRRKPTP